MPLHNLILKRILNPYFNSYSKTYHIQIQQRNRNEHGSRPPAVAYFLEVRGMARWHYFNEEFPFCFLEDYPEQGERMPVTVCGRNAENVLHTENRTQVTCRVCLHGIVKLEDAEGGE